MLIQAKINNEFCRVVNKAKRKMILSQNVVGVFEKYSTNVLIEYILEFDDEVNLNYALAPSFLYLTKVVDIEITMIPKYRKKSVDFGKVLLKNTLPLMSIV